MDCSFGIKIKFTRLGTATVYATPTQKAGLMLKDRGASSRLPLKLVLAKPVTL